MQPLAAAQFNEKTREIILGESGPYHRDWQRVLIYPDFLGNYLDMAEDAQKTLQEMLHTNNTENPWLGIAASVALLQQNREPLYCDVCGEKLQRESCNHVRACVKCNQQKATISKGVLPQVRLDDEYCPKCGDGNGCDCERGSDDGIPADWLRWRIYKLDAGHNEKHDEYLRARFPEGKIRGEDTFMLRGHRWKYAFSSFDDGGEYDLLVRPRSVADQEKREKSAATVAEEKLREIIVTAEAAGWNGVTNSKILTEWIKGLAKDREEWKPKYEQLLASEMTRYEAHNLLLRGTELRADEAKKNLTVMVEKLKKLSCAMTDGLAGSQDQPIRGYADELGKIIRGE